ncbi:MAG: sulfotransferase [Proteobacteria bacterium]|nr:sulfotransferase [Pseudomonadota bacterium]
MPKSPVFIVGSPRSGTSALVKALKTIGYNGYNEGNFLPLLRIIDRAVDNHFATFGRPNPNQLTPQIDQAKLKSGIETLFKQLTDQAHPYPLWFDKSGHAEMIPAIPILRQLWPDSVYVFCKRRAIENIASRLKKFPGHDFERHCAGWAKIMAAWRTTREQLPSHVYLEVDQQDLIRDTDAISKRIATLLQLDETQLRTLVKTFKSRRPQETTKGSATQMHSPESLGWSEAQIATFRRHCGAEMAAFGYGLGTEYYQAR